MKKFLAILLLTPITQAQIPLTLPHSNNPYAATTIPSPNLANSPRIDALVHNGTLDLSLQDAIALALENNLDLAIARYNIPIAQADVLRTQAGGIFRGVNTGVVQNTPGGGIGGFGTGGTGAGAGGTSGGSGGAGSGASGLVQSTLGTGTAVSSYDPDLSGNFNFQHSTTPLSNLSLYGVQTLIGNGLNGNIGFNQAFPTGTSLQATFNTDRQTSNSPFTFLNPELDSNFQVLARQHLLAGFGLAPNLRYLRIARNNQKISDQAFELQVISTVTQIANIYWDLVAAYEDEQVKTRSLDFANQTLTSARKQLDLQAIPALDVLKDEAEVANREGDLSIARSQLQFQSLLIKNALTKNLDDPILEAMPVHPTDRIPDQALSASVSVTNQPGTNQPGTNQLGTNQLGTNQPGTNIPGTNQPGTNQPGTNQPGAPSLAQLKVGIQTPTSTSPATEDQSNRPGAPSSPTASSSAKVGATNSQATPATEDLVLHALAHRIELSESNIDLQNRTISLASARNALLPTLDLVAFYGGSGLAGATNPNSTVVSTAPQGFGGGLLNTFNNSAPNYYVGVNVNVPLRNRVAKSDQVRAELESRQAELHLQQQRKQIRIEVRNAQYALDQSQARVTSALKARDLANRSFVISGKEQELGAGSALQTLAARRDLATAESNLVAARTAFQKARVELDRATGDTLQANAISIAAARSGRATELAAAVQ